MVKEKNNLVEKKLAEPVNEVVEKMYLQINSIVQGFAVSILITALAGLHWPDIIVNRDFATPCFAFASFFISIVFWSRYYFDTVIIKRSFGIYPIVWFFLYIVAEGISFTKIGEPVMWLISTGVFLFFGAGFYLLNLLEIHRKQENKIKIYVADNDVKEYLKWQKMRFLDLIMASVMVFAGAYIVTLYPASASLAGFAALVISLWQLDKSSDYKRLRFLRPGFSA
jgi:hypothetical protein